MGGEAGNGVAIKMKGAGLGAKKCEGGFVTKLDPVVSGNVGGGGGQEQLI